jgi:hypothetical protein
MAQRLSASANTKGSDGAPPGDRGAAAPEAGATAEAQRRAAAYLDLWERQLVQAALRGAPPPRRLKRP